MTANSETHRAALTEIGRSLEALGITVDELLRDPVLYATVTACAHRGTTDIATVLVMMLRGVMTERNGYREGLQQMYANGLPPLVVVKSEADDSPHWIENKCPRCFEPFGLGGLRERMGHVCKEHEPVSRREEPTTDPVCERCGEEYVRGGKVGLHDFAEPEEHGCGSEGGAADPLASKPHNWTRFEALWRDVCRAYDRLEGPYHSAKTHERVEADLKTVRAARAAFESPEPMAVRMYFAGHQVEALTPDEFVDRWSEGYR